MQPRTMFGDAPELEIAIAQSSVRCERSSHTSNTRSQPKSLPRQLMLAASIVKAGRSHILRMSFAMCEAIAAEPPLPNSRKRGHCSRSTSPVICTAVRASTNFVRYALEKFDELIFIYAPLVSNDLRLERGCGVA